MARFTIEIETDDASPAEWVDALAKVRGMPAFTLSDDPSTVTDVEVAAAKLARVAMVSAAALAAERFVGDSWAEARDRSEVIKNLTCSAYSAMRLVGGAR